MDVTQVKAIKELLLENKLTQKEIGAKFDISRSMVSEIATNRCYKEIEPLLQPRKIPGGQPKHLNLETQNVALFGQIENLRQERNLLKRQLKAASKRISVVDGIVEQLEPIIQPIKPLKKFKPKVQGRDTIDETLVLMLSDTHCDQVVTPDEVDGLEDYDFRVSARRAEVLIEEMLKFTKESLNHFRFRKLVIMGLGDYTSGQIHDAHIRSYFAQQTSGRIVVLLPDRS